MTEERIRSKLNTVRAVMNMYESWFLSGDIVSLRYIHNLVARPLLDEAEEALAGMDGVSTELKMQYVDERLRSMTCCALFGELQAATTMLVIPAADGDLHIASLVKNSRAFDTACEMADEVLSFGDWEDGLEAKSQGRLVRIFFERLTQLKEEGEKELASFMEDRERLEQLEDCKIDEYAVDMRQEQLGDCLDILDELKEWLDNHPELDPGEDFLAEDDADDDDDDDGDVTVTPAGVGIAVLDERLFERLFGNGDDEEEES